MNSFPSDLTPQNEEKFMERYRLIVLYEFKRALYHHTLKRLTYNEYFAIDDFFKKYQRYISQSQIEEMVTIVRRELEELGWKTQLSFGDTGLFVFVGEKPSGCW